MGVEIERKFLVVTDLLPLPAEGVLIRQGYLHSDKLSSVRVRIAGDKGFVTIKGPDCQGIRSEFEYGIPKTDAEFMLANLCGTGIISKIRYRLAWKGHTWEIDEFLDENRGLWLAEVELTDRAEEVEIPLWIRREVTGDKRYFNTFLSQFPYSAWTDTDKE